MKNICVFVAIVLINLKCGLCFKVLGILPMGSKSHYAIGASIVEALYEHGHEVTVISPFPTNKSRKNYREVSLEDSMKKFEAEQAKEESPNPFEFGKFPKAFMLFMLYNFGALGVDMLMEHEGVQKLMKSDDKFDVCILEIFNLDAATGLADHFDCVLISYTTFGAVLWVDEMIGNQSPSSYVPNPLLYYTDKMNFYERLTNTAFNIFEYLAFNLYHIPKQRSLYKKYFPNAKKSFDEMFVNSAIIFQNNHVSSSYPRPYLSNVVDVGGIHVKKSKKLPNDIQEFLDSAHDGAIIFTMGSFIKSLEWPEDKRNAFVNVFGRLKQKVIWKYENETLPNKPDNVMISAWLPQRDVLTHPNIKLFITHGGLLGTTEAMVEGVPVLGIPIFGDQEMNMVKSSSRGYGLFVNFDDVNEENLTKALEKLLNDSKFGKNAKEVSRRFNDRPLTPQESVVYWTDYAVRHEGAVHLRTPSRYLNFIESKLIDVYSVLLVILIIFLYINIRILKFFLRKLFSKKSIKKEKKRQ